METKSQNFQNVSPEKSAALRKSATLPATIRLMLYIAQKFLKAGINPHVIRSPVGSGNHKLRT